MLIDDYIELANKYYEEYKERCILFMQVGSFYEAYSYTSNLIELSEILNIICTRRDKSKNDSPYMLGFPVPMLQKYLKKLINENYTVVLYSQKLENNNFVRVFDGIYTPSTYTDEIQNSTNYMCGIYMEVIHTNLNETYHLGINLLDISTGEILYQEEHFNNIESCITFISSFHSEYKPLEYLIFSYDDIESILHSYLINVINKRISYFLQTDKTYEKIKYQVSFFNKIYNYENISHSILELLDIEAYNLARLSIIFTLNYAYKLNNKIINFLNKPILNKVNNLILGNDALSQLNIVDNNSLSVYNNRYKSVFDVINNCCTPLGKRFLQKRIISPYINENQINFFYNLSEKLYPKYETIVSNLKSIKDIEKISRKICLGTILPNELYLLYESIIIILSTLEEEEFNKNIFKSMKEFIRCIDKEYFIDKLKNFTSFNNSRESFINNKELLEKEKSISENQDIYQTKVIQFKTILNEKKDPKIEIKENKEGKYILTTCLRGDKIKASVNEEEYTFKKVGNNCKIFLTDTSPQYFNQMIEDFQINLRSIFYKSVDKLTLFYNSFYEWNDYISKVDFCLNNCILRDKFGYCKPEITNDKSKGESNDQTNSFIISENLRHPVIEKLITKEYIPNNINTLEDKHILLFGVNSSGKSSFQKSLGISIILAQSGCYVPATKFEYKPFEKLYVRITGNDNIFKGLSSFAVEMKELNTILNNVGNKTLVIGDEVCRGTEYISAISILATALNKLIKSNSLFIFATHYHEIIEVLKDTKDKLSIYHMAVNTNDQGELVYDRKLTKGKCEDQYGLIVAKSIIKDSSFIVEAEAISKQLNEEKSEILRTIKSRYNSDVYMDECSNCKKCVRLQTHHINEQANCDKYKVIEKPHISKNSEANLMVLCEDCHKIIHHNSN